jgi:hypothetical protein
MNFLDRLKNIFPASEGQYKADSDAVIITCYFNPQRNPYRLKAFKKFYETISHLEHRVIECVVDGSQPELGFFGITDERYQRVYTKNLLWHKEALLNKVVRDLPKKYKYVFWIDADVVFTNKSWLVDAVKVLKTENIVQPFEYCIHLEQDTMDPRMNVEFEKSFVSDPKRRHPRFWKSFAANYATNRKRSEDVNYDVHGHVGFAWGARREILDAVPLYDKALVGGADHIIAHAAAGQINHSCIVKAFKENNDEIESWSRRFHYVVNGRIGYVQGELHHIWHGDIAKRQYLKRVQEFTPQSKNITKKDVNGLYETHDDSYVKQYFSQREVRPTNVDDGFVESMLIGYATDSAAMGTVLGGNAVGAIIGDMLNDNDQRNIEYENGQNQSDHITPHDHSHHDHGHNHNNDTIQSDNFS